MLDVSNRIRALPRQPRTYRRHYHNRQHAGATARAFAGARALLGVPLHVKSQAEAAALFASTRQYIPAAATLLEAEDPHLIQYVLSGRIPLLEAAATVRKRAQLVKAYRAASDGDRKALGVVVGVDAVFDQTIAPLL